MVTINLTSSTIFLAKFILTLTKNDFHHYSSHRFLQTISNCKEKVGPLKIWELHTGSRRVGDRLEQQAMTTYSKQFDYHFIAAIETTKLSSNMIY
ncbi:MAG: hypothetical protein M3044_02330 [Thermoproteota archaeon]|nr:hypothetical protein [Thermoproteota archaeon]